jgi:hypothetical protein
MYADARGCGGGMEASDSKILPGAGCACCLKFTSLNCRRSPCSEQRNRMTNCVESINMITQNVTGYSSNNLRLTCIRRGISVRNRRSRDQRREDCGVTDTISSGRNSEQFERSSGELRRCRTIVKMTTKMASDSCTWRPQRLKVNTAITMGKMPTISQLNLHKKVSV